MSPDAMTGMEANLRFAGPETMETKIFGRLSAWQNWIFQRPNAVGEKRRAHALRKAASAPSSTGTGPERAMNACPPSSTTRKIPNNVDLSSDKRLQRALEAWQPNFLSWWNEMGPEGFQAGRRLPPHRDQRRRARAGRTSTT